MCLKLKDPPSSHLDSLLIWGTVVVVKTICWGSFVLQMLILQSVAEHHGGHQETVGLIEQSTEYINCFFQNSHFSQYRFFLNNNKKAVDCFQSFDGKLGRLVRALGRMQLLPLHQSNDNRFRLDIKPLQLALRLKNINRQDIELLIINTDLC